MLWKRNEALTTPILATYSQIPEATIAGMPRVSVARGLDCVYSSP